MCVAIPMKAIRVLATFCNIIYFCTFDGWVCFMFCRFRKIFCVRCLNSSLNRVVCVCVAALRRLCVQRYLLLVRTYKSSPKRNTVCTRTYIYYNNTYYTTRSRQLSTIRGTLQLYVYYIFDVLIESRRLFALTDSPRSCTRCDSIKV